MPQYAVRVSRVVTLLLVSALLVGPLWPTVEQPVAHTAAVKTGDVVGQQAELAAAYGQLPMSFEPNVGQADPAAEFVARGNGYSLLVQDGELVLSLRNPPATKQARDDMDSNVLRMQFRGARPQPHAHGEARLPGTANYFLGNDPSRWRTEIPTYGRVRYPDIYPGIDLVLHGRQGQVEYDFVVSPGVSPAVIRVGYHGADGVDLDPSGGLVVRLADGEVHQSAPLVYQDDEVGRRTVAGGYVVHESGEVGFSIAAYDAGRPLTIDPVLAYASILGGSGLESVAGIAVDGAGHAYVVGITDSSDYPTTPGAVQRTFASGGGNVFASKFNAIGTGLVYSTFLGGSVSMFTASAGGIGVDAEGNAYVAGSTTSPDFPITAGAFQRTFGGLLDAFVVKLNPTGTALVYSTFLGDSQFDFGSAIATDAAGHAYVTGATLSPRFPTTDGALKRTIGQIDAFVAKLNPSGTGLVYSTFLGSRADSCCGLFTGRDEGTGIAIDAMGHAYVTGETDSEFLPVTPGAFMPTPSPPVVVPHPIEEDNEGLAAVFVSKLNRTGSGLVYSTYLGGTRISRGGSIAVDSAGQAHVTGITNSRDFPVTPGAIHTTRRPALNTFDVYVTKFNAAASGLVYSTYLRTGPGDIAVDVDGNAYVTGAVSSSEFPITPDAPQSTLGGSSDAFLLKLNPSGGVVLGTFLGGSNHTMGVAESGQAVAVDRAGNAYVAGFTPAVDFPVTPGAAQSTLRGRNAFVAKFAPERVSCTSTISGSHATLVIAAGGTTCVRDAQVRGTLLATSGARVFIERSTVGGAIVADAPALFGMCGSTVRGSVSVHDANGQVFVGQSSAACGANSVSGAVIVRNAGHTVDVIGNMVGGSLLVSDNNGGHTRVARNVVHGSLVCHANEPPPTNAGQPNTVRGASTGQCSGL